MAFVVDPETLDLVEQADLPPFLRAWFAQLLDPETLDLLRMAGDRQVDVRLSAKGGKVRRRPVVSFDAGPQEMVEA